MIRKHSLLLGFSLAAAVLLAGCTSDLMPTDYGSEQPLRLSVSTETVMTRAADGLYTASAGFGGGEQVEVYVNSSTKHGTYQVNSTTPTKLDALTGQEQYYPTSGDVSLYAVYPAASATNGSHTVKYDQTSDVNYKQSDLMYAKTTVSQANKTNEQQLQFGHQLVKLKVKIIKAAGVTEVTKVEMKNVKRRVSVSAGTSSMSLTNLASATGEAANAGNNEDKILIFQGSNTSTSEQTYAVVFPVQEWSNADFITVTADDKTATYKLTKNDFTFGHEYTLTLNINAAALNNTISITNWDNGGSATISPTASELSIEIDDQTYTGSALMPAFTIKDASGNTVATVPVNTASSYGDFNIYWQNNTNAGTATVAAVGKGTYAGKACAKNFTIQKAPGSISYSTTAVQKTYGNAAFTNTLTATSGTGTGTVTYSSSNTSVATVNASSGQVTIQKAGSATITATVVDGANYSYATKTASYTLTVTKATPSVTAPTAKSGLVYSGSAQQLINAGSTTGGTLKYSLNNSTWYDAATSITGTAAQSYTVYYKVVGDENYNDVAAASITATIVSFPSASSATASDVGKVICSNGHIHTNVSDVTCGGTPQAMIAYVGTASSCSHGLAIALADASTSCTWNNAASTVSSWAGSHSVSGGTWRLPSGDDWMYMFQACGGSTRTTTWTDGMSYSYGNFRTKLKALNSSYDVQSGSYWSSKVYGSDNAWYYYFYASGFYWNYKGRDNYVRAVLAF